MRAAHYTSQLRRDYKLMQKRGLVMEKLTDAMRMLEHEVVLPPEYKEHPLKGNYKGYLECHIEPDWLLVYRINGQELYFVRTGTHADLFGK